MKLPAKLSHAQKLPAGSLSSSIGTGTYSRTCLLINRQRVVCGLVELDVTHDRLAGAGSHQEAVLGLQVEGVLRAGATGGTLALDDAADGAGVARPRPGQKCPAGQTGS